MNVIYETFKTVRPAANAADIDGTFSRLHHRVTAAVLLLCCLLVSSHQHFGSPIHCLMDVHGDSATVPENVINNYCFMSSTYTFISHAELANATTTRSGAYPGVKSEDLGDTKKYHAYYQWVPLVLLIQAILFLVPHWLWTGCERGIVGNMLALLDEDLERRIPQNWQHRQITEVAQRFTRNLGENKLIGTAWIGTDLLSLFNVFANFCFTDFLLGGSFVEYGTQTFVTPTQSRTAVFPILTKCLFRKYGAGGSLQARDAICVMNLNIVNEKIFLFLWVWFPLLACLTIIGIAIKMFRITLLKHMGASTWEGTIGVPTRVAGPWLPICANHMTCADLVLFHLLARNMRPLTYRCFVLELARVLEKNA